jgi:hypothetical protein
LKGVDHLVFRRMVRDLVSERINKWITLALSSSLSDGLVTMVSSLFNPGSHVMKSDLLYFSSIIRNQWNNTTLTKLQRT